MKLTPKTLESIYIMLCNCKPFSGWNLPTPEEINFKVTNETDAMGTYLYDDEEQKVHTLTISKAKNAHLDTIIRTMAHEIIHMKRSPNNWHKHDATFRKYAHQIAAELGFDPLEL